MLNSIAAEAEGKMDKVVDSLKRDYASLRAGRANPSLLDKIMIDYYGSFTPINQTANISCPEPRLILVQPWDKSLIPVICKAIMKSDLGLNPNNDGTVIRIAVPQLTEERRKELVKTCSKKAEDAKMIVRNIRRDMNARIKSLEKAKEITEDDCKRGLEDAQKLTDKYIQKIDDIMAQKEKDILEV